jgi:UDP-N-acetylmuramoyl-tripeptide--D-alanyl-D-alanine ligase
VRSFSWTADEVSRALGIERRPGDSALAFRSVSTDTRTIEPGSLFVALSGDRFDAHDFLLGAAEAGATAAVVERVPDGAPNGLRYFEVENTLVALGALARHRRDAHGGRVVGVAGSNGKTTTKDLLRAALGARYRVHATQGNLNNLVGLPLTLLATPEDAEVLVLEMGTDQPGEIERLSAIARPDAAVITAIGEEHLEKLGDLAGVLEEELQALRGIPESGFAIVAEEPDALPARARAALGSDRVRIAGMSEGADLRPDGGADAIRIREDGTTDWAWRGHRIHVPIPGRHNVRNALIALGMAAEWGVPEADAARAIAEMTVPKLRGEWQRVGGIRVLADCYNSNPPSLIAAVELLAAIPSSGRKIAVLGTMREMGSQSTALHRTAAERTAERVGDGIDVVIATGAFVEAFEPLANELGDALIRDEDPIAAYRALAPSMQGSETILLKASRGEELERWIPLIERDFAKDAVQGDAR